jgi:hypothetical protein
MSPSTIYLDQDGNVVKTVPGTQPHPLGPTARDPQGRPYSGPYAGTWEPGSPDAPEARERIELIKEAISLLPSDDETLWTASGKPKVEAIEQVLKGPISSAERNTAWREVLHPTAETDQS